MAKNVKQVYDGNPSTSFGDSTLIYGGNSPYGATDDTAILKSNLLIQLKGDFYPKDGCRVATTANLTATYANGTLGVGATLTNSGAMAALSIDGVALAANDRVVVKDQTTQFQNGLYIVTTVGSGAVNWVLTRSTDFNLASKISVGDYTTVAQGTVNAGKHYIQNATGPFTVGTTAITFITNEGTTFSPQNSVYVSLNGSNTTGDGSFDNPYADAAAATDAVSGSGSNPKVIISASGLYIITTLNIKPLVCYSGTRTSTLVISNPVGLASAWSTASNGSLTNFDQTSIVGSIVWDFSAVTATSLGIQFSDSFVSGGVSITGQDSNQITITPMSTQFSSAVILSSLIADFRNCKLLGDLTLQAKGSGTGTTTFTSIATPISGNVSITGASSRAITATFRSSPITGTLTINGTNVTVNIDAASFPDGGYVLAGGATESQLIRLTDGAMIDSHSVAVNYTPAAATVNGNLSGIDDALGTKTNTNLIIGGNFDTNPWQRGTTFTSVATGTVTADRFKWTQVGAGVVDILKTADAPAVADADVFSSNCLNVDVTTADASIAATDIYRLSYTIEGYDWAQLAQRAFTISFWVKSTVTGIFSISFQNSGADRSYVAQYTVNTTNTWELKTVTVSASPSGGTWLYTNGAGLLINWIVAAGSNFTTSSLNTWNSDALIASTNQVNGMSSNSNFFKLQLIKIESGSFASAFTLRPVQEEIALCQRYYQKSYNQGVAPATATALGDHGLVVAATTSALGSHPRFKVDMRAAPTVVAYDLTGASGTVYKGANGKTAIVDNAGTSSVRIYTSDATNAGTLEYHYTADAEL